MERLSLESKRLSATITLEKMNADFEEQGRVCKNNNKKRESRRRINPQQIGKRSWENSVYQGGSPMPMHNFPVLLEPWERDPDDIHIIEEINWCFQ